ncbi:MAG: dienelactone hydrolase family protein [Thiothrix litoralis]
MFKPIATCCLAGLLSACHSPAASFNMAATQRGFAAQQLEGQGFTHQVYQHTPASASHTRIHVYLDGDGSPWFAKRHVTQDPTPLTPTVLALMQQDTQAALYLGRPCYHQTGAMPANCQERLWTSARYSPEVINSMVAALRHYVQTHSYEHLTLIGFSGGGTLAMLMAPRLPETKAVVTLAGNLDTAAWVKHHRYTPLTGSLNPATQAPLPAHIQQIHAVGEKDVTIPPALVTAAIRHQPNAQLHIFPNTDHQCCWEQHLPTLLEALVP